MLERLRTFAKTIPSLAPAVRAVKQFFQPPPPVRTAAQIREQFLHDARRQLATWLASDGRVRFAPTDQPAVSVIIPVYNQAEWTYQCLNHLLASQESRLQVIVVNNASTDRTAELLARVDNATVITNDCNLHFLRACNQGARVAIALHVLFLNNDAWPEPEAIRRALEFLRTHPQAGAVGAKLILPNLRLQEAGCLVGRDGVCYPCLRDADPDCALAQYRRVVDYCSGAFLMTPRSLLQRLGYFDEQFAPAYYEEVDYCLTLQSAGYDVWYDPEIVVRHLEFGSSTSSKEPLRLMRERQHLLCQKHHALLERKLSAMPENIAKVRDVRTFAHRVLYIDERLPHVTAGAGYPRANAIVRTLLAEGCAVTIYPLVYVDPDETWTSAYHDVPREVEIASLRGVGVPDLERFCAARSGEFDVVWISRHSTISILRNHSLTPFAMFGNARIIYDSEAIFTMRDVQLRRLQGEVLSESQIQDLIADETKSAADVDAIVAVSRAEADIYRQAGFPDVVRVGFCHENRANTPSFQERSGLLFVGAIHSDQSPNADSLLWFLREVWPLLGQKGFTGVFRVVGTNHSSVVRNLASSRVEIVGAVPNLSPWFDAARVFVAPTRFAAGIPHKVTEAASQGLPCVVSKLLDGQLGWTAGADYLSAETAADFAESIWQLDRDETLWTRLQAGAQRRIAEECSQELFATVIRTVLGPKAGSRPA